MAGEPAQPPQAEMLHEIARTRPLAHPDRFPEAHLAIEVADDKAPNG